MRQDKGMGSMGGEIVVLGEGGGTLTIIMRIKECQNRGRKIWGFHFLFCDMIWFVNPQNSPTLLGDLCPPQYFKVIALFLKRLSFS